MFQMTYIHLPVSSVFKTVSFYLKNISCLLLFRRLHFAMGLYSDNRQRTSKRSKNISHSCFFVLTMFWCHLCVFRVHTHLKMKSIVGQLREITKECAYWDFMRRINKVDKNKNLPHNHSFLLQMKRKAADKTLEQCFPKEFKATCKTSSESELKQ